MRPAFLPSPVALACGLLQDGGRFFFLKKTDATKVERIGLPFVMLFKGEDPVRKMTEAFLEQTGIDGFVQHVLFESRHNIGSRKRKRFIPVLAFSVSAKSMRPKTGTVYVWLSLDGAKKQKLMRQSEWLLSAGRTQARVPQP